MSYATSANTNAFFMGGCKIFFPSSSAAGWIEFGAARGVKLTESWDQFEVETDNTPKCMIGVRNQTITVEGNFLQLDFARLARMRNGLDSFSTTTFTFDSGGNTLITPQAVSLVNYGVSSSQSVIATIYYAQPTDGISIPFPGDTKTEVAEIPFKLKGVCQSTRTPGQQLYSIVDLRPNIYSTTYYYTSTAAV